MFRHLPGRVRMRSRDDQRGRAARATQRERRVVRARFHEPLDDELRGELNQLLRRRGAAARRIADDLEAIEIVIEDPRGEPERIVGHVQPPRVRHGRLREIEFQFDLKRTR